MNLPDPLPILAKPSPLMTTLDGHTRRVCEEAERITAARPFVCRKYRERTGDDLAELLQQSARWHDEGKRHKRWQAACQQDFLESVATGKPCGKRLMRAGIRHELASLEFMRRAEINLSNVVRAAVAAHHSKLSRRHQERWHDPRDPTFASYWNEFLRESNQLRTSISSDFERAINLRYKFAGVRALLQLADHRMSAAEEGELLPPLEPFAYKFPHAEKRGVQREIEKVWDEPFAILRAPTGAGKTDAAHLWAQRQIEQGRADRLVIAMPTRFTANALAISTAKNLSATGLYHSSALHTRTKDLYEPQDERDEEEDKPRFACVRGDLSLQAIERFVDKEQELARKLETPVTVTTIDHLCIALTGTREDHHAIFFSLAHACLVIDEADFYDDFTQQNIVTLLRALRALGVPILLMSATVPESARQVYAASGMAARKIYEDTTDYERSRCRLIRYRKPVMQPNDFQELLKRPLQGEPTIIYANTVRRAQELYLWFKQRIEESETSIELEDVVLYHSRFTEPHKAEKEAKLLRLLGERAWKEGTQRGVAILTQIGEISVNISADLMISELCPVDRLAQRAGRLSRFKERADGKADVIGELFVIEPYRLNRRTATLEFHPAPYGHYSTGNGWEMTDALRSSIELLEEGDYSAKTFVDLTDRLYPAPKEIASHVRDNVRALENCAVLNWLILPQEQVGAEEDDERTKDWQSRDIPFQNTVYADFRQSNLDFEEYDEVPTTYRERRRFELRHGVKCHAFEFSHAIKQKLLTSKVVRIRERDPETIWLVNENCYDEEIGLYFRAVSGDDADE